MIDISGKLGDVLEKGSITSKALSLVPYAGNFLRYYRLLSQSQWWSRAELEEYQLQQLNRMLNHAYENVPYYRRVFNERGLKPKDIQDFRDLQKLPYLTKDVVRNNPNDLRARNYSESQLERVTTGGSTGTPLSYYYERGVSRAIEWAFIKALWDRIDYRFSDKCIILRGQSLGPDRLWKPTFFGRWLMLSSYRMTDQYLPQYIEKIRQYRPRFIQGYPSAITILARYMKARKIEPFKGLRAVICASENVYPEQKRLFEDAFRCRVFSFYGLSERVALAGACEHSDYYHVAPEYGVLELVRPDGTEVKGDGKGVIVATGLTNYAMPLIRYNTGDISSYVYEKCACGRDYPMLKGVEGRLANAYIVGRNGRLIPTTGLQGHTRLLDCVERYQLYQDTKGEVVLNIVKKESFSDKDFGPILAEFHDRLGDDVKIEVRVVDDIPLTARGKLNYVVQKLPVEINEF